MKSTIDIWLEFLHEWNQSGQKRIMTVHTGWHGDKQCVNRLKQMADNFCLPIEIKRINDVIQIRVL